MDAFSHARCVPVLVGLILLSPAFGETPSSLPEVTSAWRDWLEEKDDDPIWSKQVYVWTNLASDGGEFDFEEEKIVSHLVFDPPLFLQHEVTTRDGRFVSETAIGGNRDYRFRVNRTEENGKYELKLLQLASQHDTRGLASRAETASNSLRDLPLRITGISLLQIIAAKPQLFEYNTEEGVPRIQFTSTDGSPVFGIVYEGDIRLNPTEPWLPVSARLGILLRGESASEQLVSYNPDGSGISIVAEKGKTEYRFEHLDRGDEELKSLTRLPAYGIEEPTLPSEIPWRWVFVATGIILAAIGMVFRKRWSLYR